MNILYCDKFTANNLTGGTIHIYEVVKGLSNLGHKITILNQDFVDNVNVNENLLKSASPQNTGGDWRNWPLMRNFKGEISLLGNLTSELRIFFLTFFTILFRRYKRFDVIYRRHTVINSEWILARIFKIPSVVEVNGIVYDELKMGQWGGFFSLWLVNKIERYTLPKAVAVITVTPGLKEILTENYSLKSNGISVIQNGANIDLFYPVNALEARETLNLKQEDNHICFVGNLFPWQGVEFAIKSMTEILNAFPKTCLLIVGNGPLKEELIGLARQLNVLKSLIFVGEVPHQKVPLYVNASDICVVPKSGLKSGYSPLKLYEYMACKKPVVGSRASGLEVVEEKQCGILVEPCNYHELAEAICRLLGNRELKEQMGENGFRFVRDNKSWAMVAKSVSSVLDDAVAMHVNRG